jgi:peptide/nickel transport system ATP-binding protein
MTKPLIEIRNLEVHFTTQFGTIKAVDDISFNINRGETIGIVGESGSGKSVTALSIMQLLPKRVSKIVGGEIIYLSNEKKVQDLLKLSSDEILEFRGNEISMIFQEPMSSLNPVLTCGQQVIEAILLHQKINAADAEQITLDLFEKVQLPDPKRIFQAYPHQLSGGQKQRVMIAMAMSCKPSLLIADEPTTALDVTVQKKILDLMLKLKHEINASIIFITHDLGVIAEIADKVLVMYKGKIVEHGTVQDIFKNPKHPYTKGLLACKPTLEKILRRLPVIDDFMEVSSENGKTILKEKNADFENIIKKNTISLEEYNERQKHLQSKTPILKVKNLNTWFSTKKNWLGKTTKYIKAVNDISFDVFKGETLGLVGESGCGKTTLGRTILKLIKANSGSVEFYGKSIFELNEKQLKTVRKDIQIIFQDPYSSLNPRKTIGEAILEPMIVHNILDKNTERKQRVYELLETVALEKQHYNRYPHEFSGGQRQRICIARALATNPKFIICDESVSALDVSVQATILNLLLSLQEKYELTYIFISHDLSVVKLMSDRVLVMKNGKIEEQGYSEQVYRQPKSNYTKELINSIPKGIFQK